jgi:hypothetical protein
MELYYFNTDGSYGLYDDLHLTFNTEKWTLADWLEVENCLDIERQFVARGIAEKYGKW